MTKLLVLYYSSYGHMEQMAYAAAEGVGEVAGAQATVKRVPELVPEDVARAAYFKLDQKAPIATVQELQDYDGFILGVPTRFGRMSSQMANFWDQAGGVWASHALVGKVGSVMTSTASQHGGQETTAFSAITNMLHFGMIIVGLPYTYAPLTTLSEVIGGGPYGATTIAGGRGERQPTAIELGGARFQGRHVAEITKKLKGG
jgi:NAD(P)H dehydrogenase (quinone)